MRLLDDEGNRPLNKVWLYLTEHEARELAESLAVHFTEGEDLGEWHAHLESEDGRAKEVTVAIYDPDAPHGDARWRDWFAQDRWTPEMFEDAGP